MMVYDHPSQGGVRIDVIPPLLNPKLVLNPTAKPIRYLGASRKILIGLGLLLALFQTLRVNLRNR